MRDPDARCIYTDGNNNTYTITASTLRYGPVSRENSSSGMYSGGVPLTVEITPEQVAIAEALIQTIVEDTANIIPNRLMGCGTVITRTTTTFINAHSPLKAQLEHQLAAWLAN